MTPLLIWLSLGVFAICAILTLSGLWWFKRGRRRSPEIVSAAAVRLAPGRQLLGIYFYNTENSEVTHNRCERCPSLAGVPYFALTTSPDMRHTIVISPRSDLAHPTLTEAEAEALHRTWEDEKAGINPFTGLVVKTERSLKDMYSGFWKQDFDAVLKKVNGE